MATMAQEYEQTSQTRDREYRWHGPADGGRLRDESARPGERQYALFTHLAGLLSLIDFTFLGFIATLVMWLVKRDESEFLDDHGKEAVNFSISLFLYAVVGGIVGVMIVILTLGLGAPLVILGGIGLFLLRLIGSICAAKAASRGEFYRYPMCIRLIK